MGPIACGFRHMILSWKSSLCDDCTCSRIVHQTSATVSCKHKKCGTPMQDAVAELDRPGRGGACPAQNEGAASSSSTSDGVPLRSYERRIWTFGSWATASCKQRMKG